MSQDYWLGELYNVNIRSSKDVFSVWVTKTEIDIETEIEIHQTTVADCDSNLIYHHVLLIIQILK